MRVHPPSLESSNSSPAATLAALGWTKRKLIQHPSSYHRLLVSPTIFVACWWFILAMHLINGLLCAMFGGTYLFFGLEPIYPTVAIIGMPILMLRISGWGYIVLAGAHWIALIRMLRWSLHKRQLSLTPPAKAKKAASCQPLPRCLSRWYHHVAASWARLFGIDGLVGVNGRYFYTGFFVREAIEIGLQSYQANQLSGSVRRAWITHLAVVTIVLNAVSTPLVEFVWMRRHQESARRFVNLLVDMCLDFCCAVIIPGCVVYPYVYYYDLSLGSFPKPLVYDDSWFAASLYEIRQFCVTSIPDLLATMAPNWTVLSCLGIAKQLVKKAEQDTSAKRSRRLPRQASVAIVRDSEISSQDAMPSRSGSLLTRGKRLRAACHVVIVAFAIAVVGIHARAHTHASSSPVVGCRLPLNAWFASRSPCSVMQINCHRDGIQGLAPEIAARLAPLDRVTLKKLIIAHCPSLEIPPVLVEFKQLIDLDLYNSTLLSWPVDAAATSQSMPSLTNFQWFASPFIVFPAGLLHSDMPKSFSRLVIAKSNLTLLPDDLGALWAGLAMDLVSIQLTQLERLPATFSQLQISKLRVIRGRLRVVESLGNRRLNVVNLSGNPLSTWPHISDTSRLKQVYLESTSVSTVPAGMLQWWEGRPRHGFGQYVLSLYGSPACGGGGSSGGEFCAEDFNTSNGTYRWDLLALNRPLDE